jgi:UDP-N-acetyl-D-mannosaminuronate dehydrogenase
MNIGILGVGKLGLVYALSFERHGMTVWASSYKQEYVESLQARRTDNITEPHKSKKAKQQNNYMHQSPQIDLICILSQMVIQ